MIHTVCIVVTLVCCVCVTTDAMHVIFVTVMYYQNRIMFWPLKLVFENHSFIILLSVRISSVACLIGNNINFKTSGVHYH